MTTITMPSSRTLLELLDPRGRCNARGLQRLTLCLLVLQAAIAALLWLAGFEVDGAVATSLNVAFCWIGFTSVSKRLHDMGRTAWWFAAAAVIWFVGAVLLSFVVIMTAGSGALDEGMTARIVLLVAMVAPVMIALLWMHVVPGNRGDNRFGPQPGAHGFAMPRASVRQPVAVEELAHAA